MNKSFLLPASTTDFAGQYHAARTAAVLFDHSAAGKIHVTGSEAVIYLHNVCSNHIKALPVWQGCEAFFCTATAKVVAHGHIWREADQGKTQQLWIDVPASTTDKLLQHLDRYLISEDVTLSNCTEELAQLHLTGPRAAAILQAMNLISDASGPLSWSRSNQVMIRHLSRLGLPGFDLLCPTSESPQVVERLLRAGAQPAGPQVDEVLRVEAGMPLYGVDIDETTFAPEVGRTQAISYNKGCYLGQEPIVMARDRGVVQRGLVGLLLGQSTVARGSAVWQGQREVGRTLSSVFSPQLGRAVALAYLRRAVLTPGTQVEVATDQGRLAAEVATLPLVPGTLG